jgi:hypothetical protein
MQRLTLPHLNLIETLDLSDCVSDNLLSHLIAPKLKLLILCNLFSTSKELNSVCNFLKETRFPFLKKIDLTGNWPMLKANEVVNAFIAIFSASKQIPFATYTHLESLELGRNCDNLPILKRFLEPVVVSSYFTH